MIDKISDLFKLFELLSTCIRFKSYLRGAILFYKRLDSKNCSFDSYFDIDVDFASLLNGSTELKALDYLNIWGCLNLDGLVPELLNGAKTGPFLFWLLNIFLRTLLLSWVNISFKFGRGGFFI